MASMEPSMVTIGEAAKKTGRSASTIRRFVHAIVEKDMHPDRAFILPSPAQVKVCKQKGDNFAWKLDEALVMREFERAQTEEKKKTSSADIDIITVLKNELEFKNHELKEQWEIIRGLNERLREGNILMGTLQKRLAPPPQDSVVDAVSVKPSMEASKKNVKASSRKKTPKKGLFSWMGF